MTILVVSAHPDDELGVAGTISKYSANTACHLLILGEGVTSREDGAMNRRTDALLRELKESTNKAAKAVGYRSVVFQDLPDNRFDTIPLLDIVQLIEKQIGYVKPNIVFCHYSGDLNTDHQIAAHAALIATRPIPGCSITGVYAFEMPSSTEWAFGASTENFSPNLFVDVHPTWGSKIEAIHHYESEMRDFPHPRSIKGFKALAEYRGSTVGMKAAEAFEVVRETWR